jgi:antitoxin component of MazEF toxin-antitoxin module
MKMIDQIKLYRRIRLWGNTKIVSLPVEACEDLDLKEGTGVQVTLEPIRE